MAFCRNINDIDNQVKGVLIDKIQGTILSFVGVISDIDNQVKGVLADKVLYITSKNGRLNAIKID